MSGSPGAGSSMGFKDIIASVLGMGADLVEVSAGMAASYLSFAWRTTKIGGLTALVAIALAILGSALGVGWLGATGVVVAAAATVSVLFAALPISALAVKAAEFEPISKVLRMGGLIAGWGFFTALTLYSADSGADVGKLLIASVMGGIGTIMLFGWQGGRTFLAIKMLLVAAITAGAVWLPKTSSAVSGLGTLADRATSRIIAPSANELDLTLEALESRELFDFEGDPLYWCRRDSSRPAGYRCYDAQRRDPSTGQELTPVSPEVIEDIRLRLEAERIESSRQAAEAERLRLQQAEREQAEEVERQRQQAAQAAREQAEAERIRQQQAAAELEAYRRRYVANVPASVWGTVVSQTGQIDSLLSSAIREEIENLSGDTASSSTFLGSFVTDGLHDRAFNGDPALIEKLGLREKAEKLALGVATVSYTPNATLNNVINAQLRLNVRIVDVASGGIVGEFSTEALAPGRSEADALAAARERILQNVSENLRRVL